MTDGPEGTRGEAREEARDRILEHALERMFEEQAASSDPESREAREAQRAQDERIERILVAWKRGVTGTGLEDFDLDGALDGTSSLDHAPPVARRPAAVPAQDRGASAGTPLQPGADPALEAPGAPTARRLWMPAAAAALLLALGATFWAGRPDVPGPGGAAGVATQLAALVPGERVVVEGTEPRVLEWSDGAPDTGFGLRVVAQPAAVLEWHPAVEAGDPSGETGRLAVLAGDVELDTSLAVTVELAAATLALAPESALAVHVDPGPDPPASVGAAADPREHPARIRMSLTGGSATLAYAALEQELAAGEARDLPGDPAEWWADTGERAAQLCAELPRKGYSMRGFSPDVWLEQCIYFDSVAVKLGKLLERDPLGWEVVAARFEEVPDPLFEYENRVPRGQIDFLAWESSTRALALARSLWVESPQSFSEGQMVAFASFGGFEFERELRALLEGASPELETGVLAAAYFAARGDEVGRGQLERFAEPREWNSVFGGMLGWGNALLASSALEWLGDPGPWERLLPYLREEVESGLELGFPTYAAFTVAFADYYLVEGRGVLRRFPMDVGMALHYRALEGRADTPGKIRDLVEDVASRW